MKWAWQTQFLSHALQIFKNCIFFADKQMILVLFCKISSNFELTKNLILCPIQFFSHLCLSLSIEHEKETEQQEKQAAKMCRQNTNSLLV